MVTDYFPAFSLFKLHFTFTIIITTIVLFYKIAIFTFSRSLSPVSNVLFSFLLYLVNFALFAQVLVD